MNNLGHEPISPTIIKTASSALFVSQLRDADLLLDDSQLAVAVMAAHLLVKPNPLQRHIWEIGAAGGKLRIMAATALLLKACGVKELAIVFHCKAILDRDYQILKDLLPYTHQLDFLTMSDESLRKLKARPNQLVLIDEVDALLLD